MNSETRWRKIKRIQSTYTREEQLKKESLRKTIIHFLLWTNYLDAFTLKSIDLLLASGIVFTLTAWYFINMCVCVISITFTRVYIRIVATTHFSDADTLLKRASGAIKIVSSRK